MSPIESFESNLGHLSTLSQFESSGPRFSYFDVEHLDDAKISRRKGTYFMRFKYFIIQPTFLHVGRPPSAW